MRRVVVSAMMLGVILATALLLVTRRGSAPDAAPEAVALSIPSSAVHAEMELLVSLVADRGYSKTVICAHDKGTIWNSWSCGFARHWDCRNSDRRRKCPAKHYAHAKEFFDLTPARATVRGVQWICKLTLAGTSLLIGNCFT